MDTAFWVVTLSASLWSLHALFVGPAGEPGMRDDFELIITPSNGAGNTHLGIYFGVAAATLSVLAHRYPDATQRWASECGLGANPCVPRNFGV
ncbi:hypothetical protein [Mycobacterium lacus]|nr:hypothetical protein [Mycobacterium lacus]MCV7125068.1 hypothetical protein [Mycobacterium lacus]